MRTLPFWGVHVGALLGVAWLGWSWTGLALAVGLYYARMFLLTAGYHRYFAHRAFRTSRAMQLVLAVGGTLALQRGVLWWTANHRTHHRHADGPGDVHSPRLGGFWWSHARWFLSGKHKDVRWEKVRDLSRYPELVWLDRHYLVPVVSLALLLLWVAGPWGLVWGFFVSTVLLWHGTFIVNSLAHRIGRRRYDTDDDSRNSLGIALLTMGEGWHNNHHRYPGAANQGFFWWEIDLTYYLLCLMASLGLIWDLRRPPRRILETAGQRGRG